MWISAAALSLAFVIALALYWGALRKISISGKRKRISLRALGIVLTLAGTLLAFSQGPEITHSITRNSWPSVPGQVTATTVTGQRASMPQVTYAYSVNDSSYEIQTDLNVPGFGSRGFRRQTASNALIKYPVGGAVTVYYNPEEPSISSLRRGFHWAPLARMSFGGILFVFGISLSIVLFKRELRN